VSVACVVKTVDGDGVVFSDKGWIKGDADTIWGGSKSHDWNKTGTNLDLRDRWGRIDQGATTCRTSTSMTVAEVINYTLEVVAIVGLIIYAA
jgi:hypothetical protein